MRGDSNEVLSNDYSHVRLNADFTTKTIRRRPIIYETDNGGRAHITKQFSPFPSSSRLSKPLRIEGLLTTDDCEYSNIIITSLLVLIVYVSTVRQIYSVFGQQWLP